MKKREVLYFHLILAFFCMIIGYSASNLFNENLSNDFMLSINTAQENPGIIFFFTNNIRFFLMISILPFINLYLFIMQFLSIGFSISKIINISLLNQFFILYRHLFFEVIGIVLAILVSYRYVLYGKNLLNDVEIDWKKEAKFIGLIYLAIFICTMIGALLEGTSYVVG